MIEDLKAEIARASFCGLSWARTDRPSLVPGFVPVMTDEAREYLAFLHSARDRVIAFLEG